MYTIDGVAKVPGWHGLSCGLRWPFLFSHVFAHCFPGQESLWQEGSPMGEWRRFVAERNVRAPWTWTHSDPTIQRLKTNNQTNKKTHNYKTGHMTRRNSYKTQKAGASAGRPPQLSLTLREKLKPLNSEENADLSVLQPGGEGELEIQQILQKMWEAATAGCSQEQPEVGGQPRQVLGLPEVIGKWPNARARHLDRYIRGAGGYAHTSNHNCARGLGRAHCW